MNAPTSPRPVISLFGSYEPKPGDADYQFAYDVGKGLAEAGFDICNGGYDGIMIASAHGAKDGGGNTIGVTCNLFTNDSDTPPAANEYIDKEIAAAEPFARIRTMMDLSAGYVVLTGGTGTLSEFANVWEFVAKKLTRSAPIVAVGDYWKPMVDTIATHRPKHAKLVHFADTAEEVVDVMTNEIA